MGLSATGRFAGLVAAARAGEWWEYKLVPVFAVFYATGLVLRVPIWTLWPAVPMLLVALVPGAIYVSVVNDLTDRADDAAAGKRNRMAGRPRGEAAALVALPVLAGLAVAWSWRGNPSLLLAYGGAWAAFSSYSLPPFRLKTRGFAGVIADASGAHLFPSLIAALLVFAQAGRGTDGRVGPWLIAVALWAGAYGVRGILWHQLSDRDADDAAGVTTFAQRRSPDQVAALARWVVAPVEVAALAVLLWMVAHPLPVVLLLVYAGMTWLRVRWWNMTAVMVRPRQRYLLVLHDFYDVWLPLSLLLASARNHPADWAAVALHLLVFPVRARGVGRDVFRLARQLPAHVPPLQKILSRIRRVFR